MKELSLISKALRFASDKHKYTRRKGTDIPYIDHPVEVMDLLVQYAGVEDPVLLAGALMHDLIEDEGVTKEELVEMFGQDVADLVDEVSDDPDLSRSEQIKALREKAPLLSIRAALLKLADKTSNIRSVIETPPPWQRSTKVKYLKQAKAVVEALPELPEEAKPLFDLFYELYERGMKLLSKKRKSETLRVKVLAKMKKTKSKVFLVEDFISEGDAASVSKLLSKMVADKKLIRAGRGIYVKARINRVNGDVMPDHENGSDGALIEFMDRLNEPFEVSALAKSYAKGETTQIPARLLIKPLNKGFKRKLVVGNSRIN